MLEFLVLMTFAEYLVGFSAYSMQKLVRRIILSFFVLVSFSSFLLFTLFFLFLCILFLSLSFNVVVFNL